MDGKVFDDQASQIFLRTIDGDVAQVISITAAESAWVRLM